MEIEHNKIHTNNFESDEMSIKDVVKKVKIWFNFLKSKWKSISIAILFGGVIGFVYTTFDKPTYKATLTFAMEEDKGSGSGANGLSGAIGLASSFGIDLGGSGGGAFAASNIAELMKSKLIVKKVLLNTIEINKKKTTLASLYFQINNQTGKSINFVNLTEQQKSDRKIDSIIGFIYKKLLKEESFSILQKDKKVSILTIEVKSKDENFAKYFCENLATETSNFYIFTKSKKARLNVEVLQKQVDSVKNSLYSSISGVAKEVDNVYNLNPAYNLKAASSKKIQVDVQSNTAILTNLSVQLELAKITLRKETPLIQLIDSPSLPLDIDGFGKFVIIFLFMITFAFVYIFLIVVKNISIFLN